MQLHRPDTGQQLNLKMGASLLSALLSLGLNTRSIEATEGIRLTPVSSTLYHILGE